MAGITLINEIRPGKNVANVPANLLKIVGKIQTLNVPAIFVKAGTPAATSTVPSKAGDIYVDTTASKVYVAKAATAAADFLILN